jgi:hypothetical protein
MATMGSSEVPPGSIANVLSNIYDNLSNVVTENTWTDHTLNQMGEQLEIWKRTIEWIDHTEAKERGMIFYFLFTLHRPFYNFFNMTFRNPRIDMPGFAQNLQKILGHLIKIQKTYEEILGLARSGNRDKKTIQTIDHLWDTIYGKFMTEETGIIGQMKQEMMLFKDAVDRNYEGIARKSGELADHMPFSDSSTLLEQKIIMLDEIGKAYWEWAKERRRGLEREAADEAAKALFMGSAQKTKIFLDNQNGFFKHGAAYEPNFIVEGKGGLAGSVQSSHYDLLTDMVRSKSLVLLPLNTFPGLWEKLKPDMRFVIRKILQISELSVRHGPYLDRGAKVEVQGQLKPKKQREHSATYEKVRLMFIRNLKRFFINTTVDKYGKEVEYAGVGTRSTGTGEAKFSRRLKYLNQSDYTLEVFKKIRKDEYRQEFDAVAEYVKKFSDEGIFQFEGKGSGRGGKRRKTRRRKRKTKRRKKTRRRKRTKKRKRKKNKRRKTKRRRRK